jgi:hypothetical protein
VLDVTYGEGRFYYLCRHELDIVGVDPVRRSWVVQPKQFLQMNVFQLYMLLRERKLLLSPEVVVVDPPRWNDVSYNRRDMYNFVIGTPKLIIEYAAKTAALLEAPYLLVHFREILKIENFKPTHVIEFKWFARYLNTENKNKSLYILYSA